MSDPDHSADSDRSRDPVEDAAPTGTSRVDEWTAPLFTDPTLHPLLLVVGLVLGTFLTGLLLLLFKDRSFGALAALLAVAFMTFDLLQRDFRRRRLSRIAGAVLVLWTVSMGAAAGVVWAGWY